MTLFIAKTKLFWGGAYLDEGTIGSGGEEGRDAGTARTDTFGKGALSTTEEVDWRMKGTPY